MASASRATPMIESLSILLVRTLLRNLFGSSLAVYANPRRASLGQRRFVPATPSQGSATIRRRQSHQRHSAFEKFLRRSKGVRLKPEHTQQPFYGTAEAR